MIFELAQHVSSNSLPILRSARLWFTASGIMPLSIVYPSLQDIISCAVNHNLALLRMVKELPETCWGHLKINKVLLLHLVGHLLYQNVFNFVCDHKPMPQFSRSWIRTKFSAYIHVNMTWFSLREVEREWETSFYLIHSFCIL